MSAAPWWQSAVVYQIYPRTFADADGDGIGDLPGITARLDYLAELGVDVLWLSPIYPSPQDDAGYDISDYQGDRPDVRHAGRLRRAARRRPRARDEARHGPRRQPHVRRASVVRRVARRAATTPSATGTGGGARPNNWRSFFSGSAWELDPATGEHYLHLFSRKQPDLNWENPEVREAVYAMMRWWLDRGVDGFRMDVINFISKHPGLPDGAMPDGARHGDGTPYFCSGRASTSSWPRCTARCSPAATSGC